MPSPFPGMDPWLESPGVFPDLHNTFITFLRGEINRRLPSPFRAAIAIRIYVEQSERRVEPDIDILSPTNGTVENLGANVAAAEGIATLLEVPSEPLPNEEITESFIEIRTTGGNKRLVTSIEILSPTNKIRGSNGRALYLAKQHEMRTAGVNLVEIDLLRHGAHTTAVSAVEYKRRYGQFTYHICFARADQEGATFVVPFMISQRLPIVPIPITPDVPDIAADLQSVFDRCYEDALYNLELNYSEPCDPALTPDQQTWADGILREKSLLK